MSDTIIVAALSLLGTLVGSFSGILAANKLTNYRIEQLEIKVGEHNNIIDRVYKLEKADDVEREKIDVINHRIEDLEKFHSPN